jgi:MFS family permease
VAGVAGGALLARRLSVPLAIGGVVGGVGLAWLALSGGLVMAMIAIGVAVAGLLLLDVVNTTMIQRIVPDELRGRAMGVLQTSSAVVYSLGSLLMPIIASLLGVPFVLVVAAVIVVAGVGAALLLVESQPAAAPIDPSRLRLLEHPVFAGLPAARLETAARQMTPRPMHAGEVIIREGDAADRFYLIADGTVHVTKAAEAGLVAELASGDVFGEIGLLRNSPRTATVTANSEGTLMALDADAFMELVSAGPGLSSRLLDLYRGALSR